MLAAWNTMLPFVAAVDRALKCTCNHRAEVSAPTSTPTVSPAPSVEYVPVLSRPAAEGVAPLVISATDAIDCVAIVVATAVEPSD